MSLFPRCCEHIPPCLTKTKQVRFFKTAKTFDAHMIEPMEIVVITDNNAVTQEYDTFVPTNNYQDYNSQDSLGSLNLCFTETMSIKRTITTKGKIPRK